MARTTGVFFAMGMAVSGCVRYRTLPVSEALKVSYENVPPSGAVVVEDIEGQRVHIEHFRYVEVLYERCRPIRAGESLYCYEDKVRYFAPVYLRHQDGLLLVVPSTNDPKQKQLRWFTTADQIRVVDRSASRGLIMIGAALATFAVVGLGTAYAVSHFLEDDRHGYRSLFLVYFVGAAAGGASLLITGPLTKDLGTPVR